MATARSLVTSAILGIASLVTATAVVSPASADVAPPDKVAVDIVSVTGSGCPSGTASVAVSSDRNAFTIFYSGFIAQAGSGVPARDSRRNCQMILKVSKPQGYTFGVARIDHGGYASLQQGVSAQMQAGYYFAGEASTRQLRHNFYGPLDESWQTTDPVGVVSFESCGQQRNLIINTELRVSGGGSASDVNYFSVGSHDGTTGTTYSLAWKQC
ncbi:DUF4360 domain-containing protein [Nocardia sp. CDC160]|uniref:DUF4360 domain-containing protein n=1 Tax=Nocardia sp. CDC160 TaxID=3112166 RepID=UPI002DBF66FE|nr:DUF4360 domain-containing protein [Nocardia sp. CDC160]MEC3918845.1 DUF4360 domain-containing protein [Nocardia sp. CDC160]